MTDITSTYLAIAADSYNERSKIVYLGDDKDEAEIRLYAYYCELCNIYEDEMRNSRAFCYSSQENFIEAASDEISTAYIQYDDFDSIVPHRINFELHVFRHVQKIYAPDSYEEIINEKLQRYFYPTASINDKDNGCELG